MGTTELNDQPITLDVENVGGIDEASVALEPGVSVLSGRNATNRTSFLQAIMAAVGSEDVSVKADANEARVELTIGDETHSRTIRNQNGSYLTDGDPYLDDPLLADLFAFLLESNDVRRAVSTDKDLRTLIMQPIDTDEVEEEIDRLVERRRQVASELDELDSLKKRLPTLEEERTRLRSEIQSKREELEALESELDEFDTDVEESRTEESALERKLSELRSKRTSLEDVRYDLETETNSLSSLRTERTELEDEFDALPATPAGQLDDLESETRRLRERKKRLESEHDEIQSVVRFNEEMLNGSAPEVLGELQGTSEAVTDRLLPGEVVTCWTCNSEVEASQIEATVETLRTLGTEKLAEINDLEDDLDEQSERRRELENAQRERERIERRLSEVEREIENAQERIDDLTDRRETVRATVSDLEDEIEAMEDDSHQEILEIHREANQLEYDLGSLEGEAERVDDEIESIEEQLRAEDDLGERRTQLQDEIEELRTTVERIERQAIEEFNTHMDTVLEILDYENLERVWLERTDAEGPGGKRSVTESSFALHVIRKTETGTTYEDTVEHLSESEREVTGLILGLAGYLVHDVYEAVPFVLLDSLEAIDSERIATLVEYLNDFSPALVVALLEEDAAALPDRYHYVTDI
jgi:predicted  nucleic acid-binding Zn-ribbon protein